jgi:Ca-activated chloride channel homolog
VNRHLIEGLAQAGLGEPFVILNEAEATQQAARFRNYIAQPVLTDIKVDYRGFAAQEMEPQALPDLFALRPLTLMGKYTGPPEGEIIITGKTTQGPFKQAVKVTSAAAGQDNSVLRLLWARQRVQRLAYSGKKKADEAKEEITRLGLSYGLMTPFTSFVAVDQVKRADGRVETVKQPLPLPQGVSDLAVGEGGPASGNRLLKARLSLPLASLAAPPRETRQQVEVRPTTPATDQTPSPGMTLGIQVLKVTGGLQVAEIQSILEAGLTAWREAYVMKLRQGARLPQELHITLRVDSAGQVQGEPVLKESIQDEGLKQKLLETLQALKFNSLQEGSAVVTVKLMVSP